MKHLLILLGTIVCLSTACKNKKALKAAPEASSAAPAAAEAEQKMESLQQLVPLTGDEMNAVLPIELAGDSASVKESGNNMGTGFARAVYKNDSTGIEISIFDCGGTAGAGIYQAQFVNQLSNQSKNGNESTKVIDFKGGQAIEHADKGNNTSSLTYLSGGRLLVILEGKNVGTAQLKKIAADLKLMK